MPRINKTLIGQLSPEVGRDLFAWDDKLRGFGLRMKPSGRASFVIQYKTAHGSTRRMTLGQIGALTPDQARNLASARLCEVEHGGDPSTDRRQKRGAAIIKELCEEYLEAGRKGLVSTRFKRSKRPSTIAIDEGRVLRHIVPLIGSKVANEVTRPDVQRMADAIAAGKTAGEFKTKARGKARVTGGQGSAARVVALFGGIWTWAERRGLVSGANPAHGIEVQHGEASDRVLTRDELRQIGEALAAHVSDRPMACGALRLIALTGLRREEACGLRWNEIDWDGSCLRLQATKTGRSTRPIGRVAIELLRSVPPLDTEFLFPNQKGNGRADLKKAIAGIFNAAGLKDARAHDLRRTFASMAAELDYGDATIAELLGHARRGVTARHYVRRPDSALIAAATATSNAISNALYGTTTAVVEFSERSRGILDPGPPR
jgi:integrase